MSYKPGDAVSFRVPTYNQSKVLTAASSLSVGVYKNDVLDATITPTQTPIETGVVLISFTIPLTYAKGDRVRAEVDATCDTKRQVKNFFSCVLDSKRVGDLNDLSAANVNTEVDTALADYDAPTNAEMVARTLAAADYFDPATDAVASVTTVGSVTGNVGGNVAGSVNSVATGVTVTTNNDKTGYTASTVSDKTGYSLSSAGVQAIWDALTSALTTVGSIGKLLADNVNATISSRLPTASYTAPDNAGIATIQERVTDVTEDDGGTYRFTTNALEQAPAGGGSLTAADVWTYGTREITALPTATQTTIDDTYTAVQELNVGSGTGARTVTVTVTDGADPIEGAKVRLTKGIESYVDTTDADGIATLLVDDGTWTQTVTATGYIGESASLVVNGDETAAVELTAVTITPAADPDQITGYTYTYDASGAIESGVTLTFQLVDPAGGTAHAYGRSITSAASNGSGLIEQALERGAIYYVQRGDGELVTVTVPTVGDSFELPEILGSS